MNIALRGILMGVSVHPLGVAVLRGPAVRPPHAVAAHQRRLALLFFIPNLD
jgi:hypothetical protein